MASQRWGPREDGVELGAYGRVRYSVDCNRNLRRDAM